MDTPDYKKNVKNCLPMASGYLFDQEEVLESSQWLSFEYGTELFQHSLQRPVKELRVNEGKTRAQCCWWINSTQEMDSSICFILSCLQYVGWSCCWGHLGSVLKRKPREKLLPLTSLMCALGSINAANHLFPRTSAECVSTLSVLSLFSSFRMKSPWVIPPAAPAIYQR